MPDSFQNALTLLAAIAWATPPEGPAAGNAPLVSRGIWVADADGKPTPPGSFTRGLQTSGLIFREGELWSIGDQRSQFPGQIFRMDPRTARLLEGPVKLEVPPETAGENPEFAAYRRIPNSDFEGFALHPLEPGSLYAITEDKIPWVAEIRLEKGPEGPAPARAPDSHRARIVQLTRIRFPADAEPWRDDLNFRFEGCAIHDDGKTLFLAFERAKDELPRLYRSSLDAARSGKEIELEKVVVAFGDVPPRKDKPEARLNLNDIAFFRHQGRPALLAVARDQERLLVVDLEKKAVTRYVDLDLLDPTGAAIEWASPEGVALDAPRGRVWIITDPDSVGKSYRARAESAPTGQFADYSPLLFELELGTVLGATGGAGQEGDRGERQNKESRKGRK